MRPRRERASATSRGLRAIVVAYVGLLVLVPVVVLCYKTFQPGLTVFLDALRDPDAQHAFQVTAVVAGTSVLINMVFGVAVAILLARYRFPGRRVLSAFVDLPVAVSPIVVGLALILVFGPDGWFGPIANWMGLTVITAKPGMVLATVFVSLPLVVRAVVPVLEQTGIEQEQAAASLGANAFARFRRITLPTIRVALAYGVVLSLARCVGEYGAVLVVSGNIQGETETVPLRIGNLVENTLDTNSAYALTFVLMVISIFAILVGALIRRRKRI
ncbi:MAG: sulfate/thiosulfate transport system permease protein [Pseudonocardiales bacterium]|nr:sulfate/thiosulfate transport system permease protein [Pseudonocardiales bacterium]